MSLVASVNESLEMILQEGKENCYARHEKIAAAIRAGLQAMGLTLFPEQIANRSPALTAIQVTQDVSVALRNELKMNFGIVVAGGLGKAYKDTVLRIAHMGHIYPKDALTIIAALEASLYKLGHVEDLGQGVAACIRELTGTMNRSGKRGIA